MHVIDGWMGLMGSTERGQATASHPSNTNPQHNQWNLDENGARRFFQGRNREEREILHEEHHDLEARMSAFLWLRPFLCLYVCLYLCAPSQPATQATRA